VPSVPVPPHQQRPAQRSPPTRRAVEDREPAANLLGEMARRKGPQTVAVMRIGLPGDRQPTRDELLVAASRAQLVRFRLPD